MSASFGREDQSLRSIREGRRADYLFDTKSAAEAVGCHPNKFSDWWYRSKRKLLDLYAAQPGATAAELAALLAEGEQLRQYREAEARAKRAG